MSFYSKSELARFKKYKKHFVDEGYPVYVAEQYAWDMIHVRRRSTGNIFNLKVKG